MKIEEELKKVSENINTGLDKYFSRRGKIIFIIILFIALVAVIYFVLSAGFTPKQEESNLPVSDDILPQAATEAPVSEATKEIEIEDIDNPEDKIVSLAVEDYGRQNPFLPPNEAVVLKVPKNNNLLAPPETLMEEADAVKVMETKVSGIMYEPKNPSAILNIDGSDYLVRSGDYINNYKVLSIGKEIVTVQLGANVYKARVGEVLADGELNYNNIYNLEKRFGGAKK